MKLFWDLWQTAPTWVWERSAAAVVLFSVAGLTNPTPIGFITALAVLLTFAHVQIADRLQEAQATAEHPSVECHRKLMPTLVAKEISWCAVWVLTGLWPAMAGSALFLVYPIWRKWYRRMQPAVR